MSLSLVKSISALRGRFAPASDGDVVPPSGPISWLTAFTAGAMTFLAVFALALSLASGRLANRWAAALDRTATVRLSAPPDQIAAQEAAILAILQTTPGIASARALDEAEQQALLEPWFGPDLPVDALPLPRLIEVVETGDGYDAQGLRLRLAAEAPGAVLDDHTRWRRPLAVAAERLRLLGVLSILLIAASTAAIVTMAANAALAANHQVIQVLRLVGAKDAYIARAFTRRFTLRAFWGAIIGMVSGGICIAILPSAEEAGGFLTGLGFQGLGWVILMFLPPLTATVAYLSTRAAARAKLKEMS